MSDEGSLPAGFFRRIYQIETAHDCLSLQGELSSLFHDMDHHMQDEKPEHLEKDRAEPRIFIWTSLKNTTIGEWMIILALPASFPMMFASMVLASFFDVKGEINWLFIAMGGAMMLAYCWLATTIDRLTENGHASRKIVEQDLPIATNSHPNNRTTTLSTPSSNNASKSSWTSLLAFALAPSMVAIHLTAVWIDELFQAGDWMYYLLATGMAVALATPVFRDAFDKAQKTD